MPHQGYTCVHPPVVGQVGQAYSKYNALRIHQHPITTPHFYPKRGPKYIMETNKKASPTTDLDPPDTEQDVATLNLDGRGKHRRSLERFATLDPKEQHATLRETWKQVAMGVALRAKSFATTCSPKDFGRLYQLVMSGAVSIDKAFPPREQDKQAPRLIVNLFGSLGNRAGNIAIPQTPVVNAVSVKEITNAQPTQPGEGSPVSSEGHP